MDKLEFIKPDVLDIEHMQKLVYQDVENGNILERNSNEMATTIRSYTAVKLEDEFVGFVAVHIHTITLAEVRSLVVKKEFRGKTYIGVTRSHFVIDGEGKIADTQVNVTPQDSVARATAFVEGE